VHALLLGHLNLVALFMPLSLADTLVGHRTPGEVTYSLRGRSIEAPDHGPAPGHGRRGGEVERVLGHYPLRRHMTAVSG
jgi:hypothetical protein